MEIGIGRATAIAFARSGIQRLALTDRNAASLNNVSSEVGALYPEVEIKTIELDVGISSAVNSGVLEAVEAFGRIDVAVNVAGVGGDGKVTHENETDDDWERMMNINLTGVWRSQRAQLRAMVKQE